MRSVSAERWVSRCPTKGCPKQQEPMVNIVVGQGASPNTDGWIGMASEPAKRRV